MEQTKNDFPARLRFAMLAPLFDIVDPSRIGPASARQAVKNPAQLSPCPSVARMETSICKTRYSQANPVGDTLSPLSPGPPV